MADCLVCGQPAKSREHVIPQWITRLLGEGGQIAEEIVRATEPGVTHTRLTTTLARKTVKVCGGCNNGWMSQLESDLLPVLSDMVLGRPRTLSTSACVDLAVWMLKTSVMAMAASAEPLDACVATPLLQGLRRGYIRGDAQVRVGRSPTSGVGNVVMMPLEISPVEVPLGFQSVLCVGGTVMRAVWLGPSMPAIADEIFSKSEDGLVPILPPRSLGIDWSEGAWSRPDLDLPEIEWSL